LNNVTDIDRAVHTLKGKFVYAVAAHADGIAMGKIYQAAAIIRDERLSLTLDKSALEESLS